MQKKSRIQLLQVDLNALSPGFHRRRISAGGVGFEAFVWRGGAGPTLLVNGATHGDEYEGPSVLAQWVEQWRPKKLGGTVIVVPVLNEAAFLAGTRNRPDDGLNLARSFPGRANGTPTVRLARLFDQQLLAQCTHYIDLHSAGAAYELVPWVGHMTGRSKRVVGCQVEMARCFDRFWCWTGPYLPGRTLSAAALREIPAIYVECRGAGQVTGRDLDALNAGLLKTMIFLGLVDRPMPKRRRQLLRVTRSSEETHLQVHHRASATGIFLPRVRLGARVRLGDVLGDVASFDGRRTLVRSEDTGRVVMRRLQRSVNRGDPLFVVAPI